MSAGILIDFYSNGKHFYSASFFYPQSILWQGQSGFFALLAEG
jgi:hypothetical protein